jgi:hypothetical protein
MFLILAPFSRYFPPGWKEKGSGQPAMNRSKQTTIAVKTIVVFLIGLVFVSGCVASGASPYRPVMSLELT